MTARDRFVDLVIVVAVASNFGPYLLGGIRTDQAVLYATALVLIAFAPWTWLRWRPTPLAIILIAIWLAYAIIGLVGSIGAPGSQYAPGSLLAGLDNLLLPLAVMATVWLIVTPDHRQHALGTACRTTVWLTAANGLLALASTRIDLSPILRPFWASSGQFGDVTTVAGNAAQLGRFSGVFNQPAEAGLMYGLAGLAAVYVYRDRPSRMYLALVPIFIGGVLSVSKVFLLAAAPLILWQAWRLARSRAVLVLGIVTTVFALAQSQILQDWSGAAYLNRLLNPGQSGFIDFYTAGRIGTGSSLTEVISEVLDKSPLFGFGARGLQVAYDNGWVEALVVAGIFGVVAYTLSLVILLQLSRRLLGAERQLAGGVALLAVMASVGVPALTANRSGSILWLLVALLAVGLTNNKIVGQPMMPYARTPRPVADEHNSRPPHQRP